MSCFYESFFHAFFSPLILIRNCKHLQTWKNLAIIDRTIQHSFVFFSLTNDLNWRRKKKHVLIEFELLKSDEFHLHTIFLCARLNASRLFFSQWKEWIIFFYITLSWNYVLVVCVQFSIESIDTFSWMNGESEVIWSEKCVSVKPNTYIRGIYKPFDRRSTLSKRPSTVDRNESKFANGAANPWSTLRDLLL